MSEDISKNTLLILVVLTIIISLLGTWTVINEASNVNKVTYDIDNSGKSSTTAKVALDVQSKPTPAQTTGKVILNIVEPMEDN
jgi:hypothetical protein